MAGSKKVMDDFYTKDKNFFSLSKPEDDILLNSKGTEFHNANEARAASAFAEEENRRLEYNQGIINLDPAYTSEELGLINGAILVRLMLKPLISGTSLLNLANVDMVKVATKSGMREEKVKNPMPYDNIGIVVNYDLNMEQYGMKMPLEIGDFVQVNPRVNLVQKAGEDFYFNNEYRRPGDTAFTGYVILGIRDIIAKLQKSPI